MADAASRIKIQAQVEGLEGIDRLKNAFKGLQQSLGPTDQTISNARNQILEFGRAGKISEQVIRGQIDALKGLRTQASIGGGVYQTLASDVTQLASRLKNLQTELKDATIQIKNLGFTASQAIGASSDKVSNQINTLRQGLAGLKFGSEEYLKILQRINEIQIVSNARAGRAGVTAAADAYAGATITSGSGMSSRLGSMPDTTAALNQRLSELTQNLANVTRGSAEELRIATDLSAVQKQLAQNILGVSDAYRRMALDEESAIRRAEKLAAVQRNAVKAPNVGGYRDSASGAIISRGASDRSGYSFGQNFGPGYGPAEASQLFQNVTASRLAATANQAQLMGKSFKDVATEIRLTTKASDGSTNSLEAQRAAWLSLSQAVNRGGKEYREAQREITAVDKKLASGSGRLQRFSETAGAVAASGFFGGPEALAGSLIGARFGPQGALIGGSVGAGVGQVRQQAGQLAEYVQQLNLAKVTLAQASTGQAEYNRLLQAARTVSTDYAVGLKETITGYAQVAVAARANNLSLAQTESVYRGAIAAGVAFGKSQEDIDAIVLATVQVLSKGKLSAEELQGQIGERLPGAVAKFAEATGRSLPQLSKDLQAGKVSIGDFVKFAESNVRDYDEIAKIIGSSPEKAGARLKLALDAAAETYGGFFQKAGASSQDYFAKTIANLNNSAEGVKRFTTFIVNNLVNVIKAIDATLAGIERLTGKFNETPKNKGNAGNFLSDAYNRYTSNYDQIFPNFTPPPNAFGTGAAGTGQLAQLNVREDTSPALKDQLALALAQEQAARNTLKTNLELAKNDQLRVAFSQKIVEYNKIERDFAADKINKQERSLQILKNESDYRTRVNAINRQAQEEAARAAQKAKDDAQKLERSSLQVQASQADAYVQLYQNTLDFSGFANTDLEAAKIKLQYANELNKKELESFTFKAKATMADARANGVADETANLLNLQRELLLDQQKIRARNLDLQAIELNRAKQVSQLENSKQLSAEGYQGKAAINGLQMGLAKSLGLPTALLERSRLADQQAQRRQELSDLAQSISIKEVAKADYTSKGADKFAEEINALTVQIQQEERILELKRLQVPAMEDLEIKQQKLNEFAERYGGIFDSIGQGLTKTLDLLVTGTDSWGNSLRNIASSVLQDIARQMLKIFVIEQTLSLFKGFFSPVKGISSGLGSSAANLAQYAPLPNAMGNAFARNGIQPFAMGGIVNRPTLFQFASGGSFRNGLMGEAGPEAVMPLRRGPDGRLGVAAAGGGAATTNVTINVDATGTSAQGDQGSAGALARDLAQVVDERLIYQRRPGGLLAR